MFGCKYVNSLLLNLNIDYFFLFNFKTLKNSMLFKDFIDLFKGNF